MSNIGDIIHKMNNIGGIIHSGFFFLGQLCSYNDNDLQENLAKFDYKLNIKIIIC
jgi:hypothetical protein